MNRCEKCEGLSLSPRLEAPGGQFVCSPCYQEISTGLTPRLSPANWDLPTKAPIPPERPSPAYSDLKIKKAADKVPLDLIPQSALCGEARVFQHGAKKYEAGNFLLAQDDEAPRRYCGALLRHLQAMQSPNGLFTWESIGALDEESGLPDIDHAMACLTMLRAAAIKHGAMAVDPGKSKLLA